MVTDYQQPLYPFSGLGFRKFAVGLAEVVATAKNHLALEALISTLRCGGGEFEVIADLSPGPLAGEAQPKEGHVRLDKSLEFVADARRQG